MHGLVPHGKFKRLIRLLVLCGILLSSPLVMAACSRAAISQDKATMQLSPAEQEEQDPEFWKLWEERRGLGE